MLKQKDKKKKKIQICKCSECGRKFEMPEEFSGTILCEDCDGFMNPLPKMPGKIKEELTTFILLAEEYLKRHYPNKEEPIDIRWSAVFNFANFLDKLMLERYMPMIKKAIKEKGFGDAD